MYFDVQYHFVKSWDCTVKKLFDIPVPGRNYTYQIFHGRE